MNWKPATKQITGLQTVRVIHPLKHEGGVLAYASPLFFKRKDLTLSIIRTTAIESAVPNLPEEERKWLARSNGTLHAERLNLYVNTQNAEFSIMTRIDILPDEDLTSLAAKVGMAVADLVMERLGFHWRANMQEIELNPSPPEVDLKKRRPDFVYDPAGEHGFQPRDVVVVEAKGSLSRTRAKRAAIRRLARKAFADQVEHIIGQPARDVVVAGGYAVAFGAIPGEHAAGASGEQVSTLAVASPESIAVSAVKATAKANSLSAAATYGAHQVQKIQEQEVPHQQKQRHDELLRQIREIQRGPGGPGGPGGPTDGGPRRERGRRTASGRIAYANYEYGFLLCGADNAAEFLRNILTGQGVADVDSDRSVQEFWVVEHARERFWTAWPLAGLWWPNWEAEPFLLGIHENSAKEILLSASNNLERIPDTVVLTVAPITEGSECVSAPKGDPSTARQINSLTRRSASGPHAD
jgi:hypothetical protein